MRASLARCSRYHRAPGYSSRLYGVVPRRSDGCHRIGTARGASAAAPHRPARHGITGARWRAAWKLPIGLPNCSWREQPRYRASIEPPRPPRPPARPGGQVAFHPLPTPPGKLADVKAYPGPAAASRWPAAAPLRPRRKQVSTSGHSESAKQQHDAASGAAQALIATVPTRSTSLRIDLHATVDSHPGDRSALARCGRSEQPKWPPSRGRSRPPRRHRRLGRPSHTGPRCCRPLHHNPLGTATPKRPRPASQKRGTPAQIITFH